MTPGWVAFANCLLLLTSPLGKSRKREVVWPKTIGIFMAFNKMPTYLLESWQQVTSLLAMELVFDPKLAAKEGVGTGNASNAIQQEASSLGTKISQDSKEVMDIRLDIVRNQLQVDIYYPRYGIYSSTVQIFDIKI